MNQPLILGQNGQRMVAFGGPECWKVARKGDVAISFQWLDTGHESGEDQPCMCLYKANATSRSGAFVIPQEASYHYANRRGDPTAHLFAAAFKAAVQMGFFPDQSTVNRVVDIVVEYLPELVRMPSAPVRPIKNPLTQGIEVALKLDGKTIHEALI